MRCGYNCLQDSDTLPSGRPVALCYLRTMSQPVKLSDSLVLDARFTAKIARRSIAGQVQFSAALGRAVEPLLRGHEALALCKTGAANPLSQCLESVDSLVGYQRVSDYLNDFRPHITKPPPGIQDC